MHPFPKCNWLSIEHFKLLLDNYHYNSFQIWCEASLGQGRRKLYISGKGKNSPIFKKSSFDICNKN
jgi:hypothetical protein